MSELLWLKCPKCKGQNYTLIETVEEHVIYSVRGGVIPNEATDHEAGSILGVQCKCEGCGYPWKPRGVTQWTDAISDSAEVKP